MIWILLLLLVIIIVVVIGIILFWRRNQTAQIIRVAEQRAAQRAPVATPVQQVVTEDEFEEDIIPLPDTNIIDLVGEPDDVVFLNAEQCATDIECGLNQRCENGVCVDIVDF